MVDNIRVPPNIEGLSILLVLQDEVKKLTNLIEFGFFTTNETHRLLPYHTAYLWQKTELNTIKLVAQSGIAELDMQAPINQWLDDVIKEIISANLEKKIIPLSFGKSNEEHTVNVPLDDELLNHWPKELPENVLWSPLFTPNKDIAGGLVFFRDNPFSEQEVKMFQWLANNYQYTWATIVKPDILPFRKLLTDKMYLRIAILLSIAILLFPVRLSVLASATVESKEPALINAPIPGVIRTFFVKPGDTVKAGQLLLTLDDRDLNNSVDVSQKKVVLGQAKLRSATHEGFNNQQSRSEIPVLQAEIKLNQSELDYTKSVLEKTNIVSPINGVVIFDSKEDWIGQPVQTGENILTVANPREVNLKITLPVTDLIKLEKGSEGKFYLYGQLSELPVVISTLSYNAKMMPNKVLAYQLLADFTHYSEVPRLGSQGNVRLYGHYVPVIYYLIRRPLQFIRQTFGI